MVGPGSPLRAPARPLPALVLAVALLLLGAGAAAVHGVAAAHGPDRAHADAVAPQGPDALPRSGHPGPPAVLPAVVAAAVAPAHRVAPAVPPAHGALGCAGPRHGRAPPACAA